MNLTAQTLDMIAAERARRGMTTPLDKILLWAALMMNVSGTAPMKLKRGDEPVKLARNFLKEFTDESGRVPLYHYMPHEYSGQDTAVTDPSQFGKSPWSASERKADGTPKTFFYTDLADKEGFFNNRPLFHASYPADKIYDATADPEGHAERSRGVTDLIARLKQHGYHGIFYSGVFPTVAMWQPVQVTRHQEEKVQKLGRVGPGPYNTYAPNPQVQKIAQAYHVANQARLGLPPHNPTPSQLKVNSNAAKRAGIVFNALKHDPSDPAVKASYDQFKKEILAQYDHAVKNGLRVKANGPEGHNYLQMHEDLRRTGVLPYEPTLSSGFGQNRPEFNTHPLLEQAPGQPRGVLYNDLFRIIHDYYGHVPHGHDFSPTGELRAWNEHARMFSPLARHAMTTETHGQNSWLHYGPHLKGHETSEEKPYADQKAALLPKTEWPLRLARPDETRQLPGLIYVSPSTREGSTFQQAYSGFASPEMEALVQATPGGKSGYGVWTDGAEETRMFPVSDLERLPVVADTLGKQFKQKSVGTFTPDETGPDSLHILTVRERDPETIHNDLMAHGLDHKTILATPEGSEIHLLDQGNQNQRAIEAYAHGTQSHHRHPGHVDFRNLS